MKRHFFYTIITLFSLFIWAENSQNNRFILMTTLYHETDSARIEEYKTCILHNLQNKNIEKIVIIFDYSKDSNSYDLIDFLKTLPVTIYFKNGRATYGDFFDLANNTFPNRNIVLVNGDIFFDETFDTLNDFNLDKKFLAITRWNIEKNGTIELTKHYQTGLANPGSHDTWIFRSPITIPNAHTIPLGIMQCDGAIAFLAQKAGYTLLNPCLSVHCLHLHQSPVRHYWHEEICKGPLLNIPISTLP